MADIQKEFYEAVKSNAIPYGDLQDNEKNALFSYIQKNNLQSDFGIEAPQTEITQAAEQLFADTPIERIQSVEERLPGRAETFARVLPGVVKKVEGALDPIKSTSNIIKKIAGKENKITQTLDKLDVLTPQVTDLFKGDIKDAAKRAKAFTKDFTEEEKKDVDLLFSISGQLTRDGARRIIDEVDQKERQFGQITEQENLLREIAKRKGVDSPLSTFTTGAAESASLGLSNALARGIAEEQGIGTGEQITEFVQEQKQRDPLANIAGQFVGFAVGPAGKFLKGVATPAGKIAQSKLAASGIKGISKVAGSKLGGSIAREVIEGTVLSPILTIKNAIAEDKTLAEALRDIPEDIKDGIIFDGAFGVLGAAGKEASKLLKANKSKKAALLANFLNEMDKIQKTYDPKTSTTEQLEVGIKQGREQLQKFIKEADIISDAPVPKISNIDGVQIEAITPKRISNVVTEVTEFTKDELDQFTKLINEPEAAGVKELMERMPTSYEELDNTIKELEDGLANNRIPLNLQFFAEKKINDLKIAKEKIKQGYTTLVDRKFISPDTQRILQENDETLKLISQTNDQQLAEARSLAKDNINDEVIDLLLLREKVNNGEGFTPVETGRFLDAINRLEALGDYNKSAELTSLYIDGTSNLGRNLQSVGGILQILSPATAQSFAEKRLTKALAEQGKDNLSKEVAEFVRGDDIQKTLSNVNKENADVIASKVVAKLRDKIIPKSDLTLPKIQEKDQEFVKQVLKTFNKKADELIDNDTLNALKQARKAQKGLKNQVLSDIKFSLDNEDQFRQVWQDTKDEVILAINNVFEPEEAAKRLEILETYFGDNADIPFSDKEIRQAINKELKLQDTTLTKIVKDSILEDATLEKMLSNIEKEMGELTPDQIDLLNKEFTRVYKNATKTRKTEILNNLLKEKAPRVTKRKTFVDRVLEYDNLGAFDSSSFSTDISRKLGIAHLTDDDLLQLRALAGAYKNAPNQIEKDKAAGRFFQFLNEKTPSAPGQKLLSTAKTFRLGRPQTVLKNLVGNTGNSSLEAVGRLNSRLIDSVWSAVDKTPVFAGTSPIQARKQALEAVIRKRRDIKEGLDIGQTGVTKYGAFGSSFKRDGSYLEQTMRKFSDLVGQTMELPDTYVKEIQRSIGEQEWEKLAPNISDKISKEVWMDHIESIARDVTLQNRDVAMVKSMNKITELLNLGAGVTKEGKPYLFNNVIDGGVRTLKRGEKSVGLGDWVLKFPTVQGNIPHRVAQFTPLGALKGIYNIALFAKSGDPIYKRDAIQALGRFMAGTEIAALGAYLYATGALEMQPEDRDVGAVRAVTGERSFGPTLNLTKVSEVIDGWTEGETLPTPRATFTGDVIVSLDNVDIVGNILEAGAKVARSIQNNEIDNVAAQASGIPAVLDAAGDNQAIDILKDAINTAQFTTRGEDEQLGKALDVTTAIVEPLATDLLPLSGISADTARGVDPLSRIRDVEGVGPLGSVFGRQARQIPGISQGLPVRMDGFGDEITEEGLSVAEDPGDIVKNVLKANFDPFKFRIANVDEMRSGLRDLRNRVQDYTKELPLAEDEKVTDSKDSIYPSSTPPRSLSLESELKRIAKTSKPMTLDEQTTYQEVYGANNKVGYTDLLVGKDIDNLSDKEVDKLLKDLAKVRTESGKLAKKAIYAKWLDEGVITEEEVPNSIKKILDRDDTQSPILGAFTFN